MQPGRCYLLGDYAVVLELTPPVTLETQQRIWGLARRLESNPAVREVIPGMNNITLVLADPITQAPNAVERLASWWEESEPMELATRRIDIPVVYGGEGGPDLEHVAHHSGLTLQQVVERHSAVDYVVYFIGFQPGFPYLGGMDSALATPRRAEPRLTVPAGSVGIGGSQTGVYPLETPGGWNLIGHTDLALFELRREQPNLLVPGDTIRFVPHKEGVC